MAGNDKVISTSRHFRGIEPRTGIDAARFGFAAETHRITGVVTRKLPNRSAVHEPLIGSLDLAAVDDGLREHPVLVAHAVAPTRKLEGGHGIQKARRKAS